MDSISRASRSGQRIFLPHQREKARRRSAHVAAAINLLGLLRSSYVVDCFPMVARPRAAPALSPPAPATESATKSMREDGHLVTKYRHLSMHPNKTVRTDSCTYAGDFEFFAKFHIKISVNKSQDPRAPGRLSDHLPCVEEEDF